MMWFSRSRVAETRPVVFSDKTGEHGALPLASWIQTRPQGGAVLVKPEASSDVALPAVPAPEVVLPEPRPCCSHPLPQEPHHEPEAAKPDPRIEDYLDRQRASIAALERSIQELSLLRSRFAAELERDLVLLAGKIAQRVIHREVSLDPQILAQLVREGLAALSEQNNVVIHLGPLGSTEAQEHLMARLEEAAPGAKLTIDDSLPFGACIVHGDTGSVDVSIDVRLDNVLRTLLAEHEPNAGGG